MVPCQAISNHVLELTRTTVRAGIEAGHHKGAQVSALLRGQHYQLAVGESVPGVTMTDETLLAWLSAAKPVLAIATCQLWEQGLLPLDTPIHQLIPENVTAMPDDDRRACKLQVTIWYLLTHTVGFRVVSGVRAGAAWAEQIAAICAAPLEAGWPAGAESRLSRTHRLDPSRRASCQIYR